MEKSYVSMERKICIVTGKEYETESILLDTGLKKSMDKYTITGWGVSPEVQEILNDDNIALIVIDEELSNIVNGEVTPENAYRTGDIAYIKTDAFEKAFKKPIVSPYVFIDKVIFNKLIENGK